MKSQTINLLKKEIKLGNTAQTLCWLICCFGMYFIPSYPTYIGPFYITLSIMLTFALNQSSHDILYTVLLPVRKIDTVKARFLYCGMHELFAILSALIALVVRTLCHMPQNRAGIGITIAYFGLQLIIFAVFNFIFLGNVYKDPLKPGKRYIIAAIAYFVMYALCEIPVWTYYAARSTMSDEQIAGSFSLQRIGLMFSAVDGPFVAKQCIILLGGVLIFAGSWCITFNRAAHQFEKYDM